MRDRIERLLSLLKSEHYWVRVLAWFCLSVIVVSAGAGIMIGGIWLAFMLLGPLYGYFAYVAVVLFGLALVMASR